MGAEGIKKSNGKPTAEDATSLFMSLLIQSQMDEIQVDQKSKDIEKGKFNTLHISVIKEQGK